ncbi:MAG: cbb3-type cytochrome c oxidase N-terminal domain-containing protein [Syntrophothermus sp.]
MRRITPSPGILIKKNSGGFSLILMTALLTGISVFMSPSLFAQAAQDAAAQTDAMNTISFLKTTAIIMTILLAVILWFVIVYATKPVSEIKASAFTLWAFIKDKLNAAAPLEKEGDIVMEDNFDGIRELDNKIPPWFNILFYGTIAFGVVYLAVFHVFGSSKLSGDEYMEEVQAAELQKEILFRSGKLVNETNVTELKDMGSIQSGKDIFISKCSVCHGRQGEGLVGPNLTDDYWIHGGGIKNVFRIIKAGVPAKGMITWGNQLSPRQMQEVASYVLSIHGTNPPNAKPPQGDKYIAASDSVKVQTAAK